MFYYFSGRSNHQRYSMKKVVLKNFAIIIGKHLFWTLFFVKLQGLNGFNFIKKRLQHRCFLINIAKFLTNIYFKDHLRTPASVLLTITSIKTPLSVFWGNKKEHTTDYLQEVYKILSDRLSESFLNVTTKIIRIICGNIVK